MMNTKTLAVEGLNYSYGKKWALYDIDVSALQPGMLVGLIGPNAAGKSTLFKCLSGMYQSQSGAILLGEQSLAELSLRKRLKKVCFMPQFFSTSAALSVFEVVLMSYKQLAGWSVSAEDRLAVARALDLADIGHLADANIAELSGGQSQMVSLCQALVRNADVYLFDEPTSALDLRHQLEGLTRIKEAMRHRNAIGIVALHDLNLAARFADHLLLLGNGRLLAEGDPDNVLSQPVIGQTYGVNIDLLQTKEEITHVSAYL